VLAVPLLGTFDSTCAARGRWGPASKLASVVTHTRAHRTGGTRSGAPDKLRTNPRKHTRSTTRTHVYACGWNRTVSTMGFSTRDGRPVAVTPSCSAMNRDGESSTSTAPSTGAVGVAGSPPGGSRLCAHSCTKETPAQTFPSHPTVPKASRSAPESLVEGASEAGDICCAAWDEPAVRETKFEGGPQRKGAAAQRGCGGPGLDNRRGGCVCRMPTSSSPTRTQVKYGAHPWIGQTGHSQLMCVRTKKQAYVQSHACTHAHGATRTHDRTNTQTTNLR
jgi:hypothetical protein